MSDSENSSATLGPQLARWLVALSSAAVLVLEILAGRLLAPYVGVSLETFTGIIGVVLAGIALGSWGGGELADQHDARRLIGPALVLGGVLSWLSLPIVSALGPQLGSGASAIILLTTAAFFLPAVILSAVGPLVAKLRLQSLADTGAVVGGLSAAGTVGALAGTFLTGFVLVSALPTRPIVMLVGVFLVLLGVGTHGYLTRAKPPTLAVLLVLATFGAGVATGAPCQYETGYACANIVIDDDNPSGRSLYLDRARHAFVDLEDPTNLDVRYIRLFTQVIDATTSGPISTLHIGGGGFSLPMWLQHTRPGAVDIVLEIDPELVEIGRSELGLVTSDRLTVVAGDARLSLAEVKDDSVTVVVGDAFSGFTVPWHLTTTEFVEEISRVVTDDGLYVVNLIDGGENQFVRAEIATLRQSFSSVVLIVPPTGIPSRQQQNQIAVASQRPLPTLSVDPADGRVLSAAELDAYVGDADPLRDDFAPVDQLLRN